MRIGYVFHPDRGETDRFLAGLVETLATTGLIVRGAVQANTGCDDSPKCDMDLTVLPDGPVIRISQSLGAASQGCRLDAGALEEAVMAVAARMTAAQVLVINKFGKHESEGRGFRDLIANAAGSGIPVIIGTNTMNRAAFEAFCGGMAQALPMDAAVIADWLQNNALDAA